jgi:RNA polymerase sigma-70 factor (ECF subfamily)
MVAESAPLISLDGDNSSEGRRFAELLAQAKAGQAKALGSLLQWYGKYLTILASTQLDGRLRRRVSPSDIVQETLLAAHRDFAAFRGQSQGELLAWLRQILINSLHRMIARHIKAEKRDIRRDISIDQVSNRLEESACNLAGRLPAAVDSPSAAMHRKEAAIEFADRLSDLPPNYRDVIVMRVLKNLSFEEIAQQMGKSSGAVRMLWLRALDSLKTQAEAAANADRSG